MNIWLVVYIQFCYYLMIYLMFHVDKEDQTFQRLFAWEQAILIFLSPIIIPYTFVKTLRDIFDKNKK